MESSSSTKTFGKAKLRLIQATLDSLMEDGIEGCSIRKISQRAGASTGLINYHFASIDDLIAASYQYLALEFLQSAINACAAYALHPRRQLSAFVEDIFSSQVMQRSVLRAWVVFWGLIDSAAAIQQAQEQSNNAFCDFLQGVFVELDKQSPLKCSPRLAAIGLSAMIDGLWMQWCLQPEQFTPTECIELCEQWVDGVLRGGHSA